MTTYAQYRPRPRGFSCIETMIQRILFFSVPPKTIGQEWPPKRRNVPLVHGSTFEAHEWLRRRYPHNPRAHDYLPWSCLAAFARRHPRMVRDLAACESSLARQLLAHVQADDAKALLRRIASGVGV